MSNITLLTKQTPSGFVLSLVKDQVTMGSLVDTFIIGQQAAVAVANSQFYVFSIAKDSPKYLTEEQQLKLMCDFMEEKNGMHIVAVGKVEFTDYLNMKRLTVGGATIAMLFLLPNLKGVANMVVTLDNGEECTYYVELPLSLTTVGTNTCLDLEGIKTVTYKTVKLFKG